MRKAIYTFSLLSSFAIGNLNDANAQNNRLCATDLLREVATTDAFAAEVLAKRQTLQLVTDNFDYLPEGVSATTVSIPVVFNIVLSQSQIDEIGGINNIITRIDSQLAVLNREYSGNGSTIDKVPAAFQSKIGNPEMYFGLAHRDPLGQSTPGYRIKVLPTHLDSAFSPLSGNAQGSRYLCADVKYDNRGLAAWDVNRYLNIWICDIRHGSSNDVLGLGVSPYFAADLRAPNEQGVVIDYKAFGSRTTDDRAFLGGADGGKTLVHEMGHFFELKHIWGESDPDNCTDDDDVSDTHRQLGPNYNCFSWTFVKANCDNDLGGEMWMNHMDYTQDRCLSFFTQGQVNRMRATFASNGKAYGLTQNPKLLMWPTDVADIIKIAQVAIYPNPTNDQLFVSYDNSGTKLNSIVISDVTGQTVYNINNIQDQKLIQIPTQNWSTGVYIINCNFDKGNITQKIVKQ